MKIKLIINEVKSWADEDKVRLAKDEKDSGSDERTARDDLKRDVKRHRGKNLDSISPLLDVVTQRQFGEGLSHVIIKFFNKEKFGSNKINVFLPIILKSSVDNKIDKASVAYYLAHFYRTGMDKRLKDILRKYASAHPYISYSFANVIDDGYHPVTWRGVNIFHFYGTAYINRFEPQIPEDEIQRFHDLFEHV